MLADAADIETLAKVQAKLNFTQFAWRNLLLPLTCVNGTTQNDADVS